MSKFFNKYSEQINGYLFIFPAFLIIGLFGIFPVFFGMYMSVHKWKVFKGRFLGFENYQRILGDIPAFWLFVLGLLLLILSYGLWSEFKNKVKNTKIKVGAQNLSQLNDYGAFTAVSYTHLTLPTKA